MKTRQILSSVVSYCAFYVAFAQSPSAPGMLNGQGMEFIENKGQITDDQGHVRPDILYSGDAAGASIYLRKGGVSYVITKAANNENQEPETNNQEQKMRN